MLSRLFKRSEKSKADTPRYVRSQKFMDAGLGPVHVVVRPNARRFIARWQGRTLSVTVPPRTTPEEFQRVLDGMRPRLMLSRPASVLAENRVIGPGDFGLVIERRDDIGPLRVSGTFSPGPRLYIGSAVDLENPAHEKAVASVVRRLARAAFPELILPRALELAGRVGVSPRSIRCSTGYTRLGTCGSNGDIRLSAALVLMPQELRDYVILHEFAHLTVFNHSPKFYELLDRYCGGQNKRLRASLKAFKFPIPV